MEDREILELLWKRIEQAIEALAEKFGRRLTSTAMNILNSRQDAEESVNDTYLAVWNAIPPQKPDSLTGFVYKTGRNQALKRLRANTAQKRNAGYDLSLDELAGCIPTRALDEAVEARALGQSIDAFLDTVSRDSRIIFLRRYWFGDSVGDIARSLGMTPNAVSVRLSRTRQQLHTYLIKEGVSMNEKLVKALDSISDRHIAEAAGAKRKRRYWLGAVAAALAVVLLICAVTGPMTVQVKAVSPACESRQADRAVDFDVWYKELEQREVAVTEALAALSGFFAESSVQYMATAPEENRVWSPVNGFIALAALAEITEGNSRQQILELLGAADLDALRAQVGALWESVYKDDGHEISALANSLWLDENLSYNQTAMDNLAYYDYASVYQCDLGSAKSSKALRTWLNNNTGGLLTQKTANADFPEEAVLTLASTVYLQSKWSHAFSAANNTRDAFHAPGGDTTCTFLNKKELQTNYYWGNSFGTVGLGLKNGCTMWFFLPDEGKTTGDVLEGGAYLDVITQQSENSKYVKVNLSVPKFDISSGGDLKSLFQALGLTDVFSPEDADFTAITADTPVFVTAVNQAARVIIDEEGVKAASYIELPANGAGAPPDEIIDFVLNRPFVFVIEQNCGIPVFVGVVNQP